MKKSLVTSFMIITVFNALDRTLGFFFRIYLSREMGAQDMGVYQVASSVYLALLTFITSGVPLVVSKRVAKADRRGEHKKAAAVTSAALFIGLITGFALAISPFVFFPLFRAGIGFEASVSLCLLAPAILFSAVYSALRGNLWGKQKFLVVAIVEVIEQVARIVACVVMFLCGTDKLYAASLSLTVGCFISAFATAVFFFAGKGRLASPKGEIKPLFSSEMPITLSRAATCAASSVLSVAAPFLFTLSGFGSDAAYEMFGAASGMALPLLFVPLTLTGSLAFVLVPSVGASADCGRYECVNRQIVSSVNFATVVACLFIPLFSACGEQIGVIVYDNVTSGVFLSKAAWILLPLSVEAITSSLMNSLDLEMRSFANSMIGYLVQAIVYAAFARSFTLDVFALGIGASLTVSAALHLYYTAKKTSLNLFRLKDSAINALLVFPALSLCRSLSGVLSFMPDLIAVILSGGAAMAAYGALSLVFGGVEAYPFLKGGKSAKRKTAPRGRAKKAGRAKA
ncbi:MAG: oligosaccharide flippase family protein [Candidatus Neoclostridium sp.]